MISYNVYSFDGIRKLSTITAKSAAEAIELAKIQGAYLPMVRPVDWVRPLPESLDLLRN